MFMNYYVRNSNQDFRRYGKGILFSNGCALNETATAIFDMLDGKTSVDAIIESIYNEYDCERDVLEKDINECIGYMIENGLILNNS